MNDPNPARWQRIEEIFASVVEHRPDDRRQHLEQLCGDDASLLAEVARLLQADAAAGAFLEAPAFHPPPDLPDDELLPGHAIGPYRVVRPIGRGGMGSVYLAVRDDGEYQKQVAIKTMRRGLDLHGSAIGRFRRERQILATLDHPHICGLLDGGAMPDGRPYLVMEYVEGAPITEYSAGRAVRLRERLELFLKVCSAVHFGHQRLVVHRDLKPGNILVTNDGTPKLLDFGIAKLLRSETGSHEETPATQDGGMTPEYASPEQIIGAPVTTATDVYSLGVLLYELLTGRRPYDTPGGPPHQLARAICEEEPPAPSAAVSDRHQRRRLRGDLDTIVLTAMRKEPSRRYSSVEQMSEDVRRYLAGLPILARADTVLYATGKFVSRHRLGVAAAAALVALTVVSAAGLDRAARVAERERADAEESRRRAERVVIELRKFSNAVISDVHDSVAKLPGSIPARALLTTKTLEHLAALAHDAEGDPTLQSELALAYLNLGDVQGRPYSANAGDTAGALESYRKAAAILEDVVRASPDDAEHRLRLSLADERIGRILTRMSEFDAAIEYHRRSLALRERLAGAEPDNPELQRLVAVSAIAAGDALQYASRPADAYKMYSQALLARQALLDANPGDPRAVQDLAEAQHRIGASWDARGQVLVQFGDRQEAVRFFREALAHHRASLAAAQTLLAARTDDPGMKRRVADKMIDTARLMAATGDAAGSLAMLNAAVPVLEQLAAADAHNREAQFDLAVAYRERGYINASAMRESAARADYMRSASLARHIVREDPTNKEVQLFLGTVRSNDAHLLEAMGELEPALEIFRDQALDGWNASRSVGRVLTRMGRSADAESYMQKALDAMRAAAGGQETAAAAWLYGDTLLTLDPAHLRDPQTAERYLQRADELSKGRQPAFAGRLAHAYYVNGAHERAVETLRRVRALIGAEEKDEATLRRHLDAVVERHRPVARIKSLQRRRS